MQNNIPANWLPITIGFCCWLVLVFMNPANSFFDLQYVILLLLTAPLWLIPMVWQVLNLPVLLQRLALPASLLFTVSFVLSKSVWAAIFVLPWLFLTLSATYEEIIRWKNKKNRKLADHSLLAAFLYLPIGVSWAFADRLGMQPLGFSPTITLLTAVHFHFAGFLLPILSALLLTEHIDLKAWEYFMGWGVIFGVPLTAIGITTTQFDLPQVIEIVCVMVMAGSAWLVGMTYLRRGWEFRRQIIGPLWLICGMALIAGMSLAMAYGWRTVITIPWLTIPWMYALHGTLNAVGFALPGVLAWWLFQKYSVQR